MEKIEIAQIVKAQGINGDVKIIVLADDDFDFSQIKEVIIDNKQQSIQKIYKLNSGYGVKFSGIANRNEAELYKNKFVYIDKNKIEQKQGRYLISDLIGKTIVLASGQVIGVLKDIQNFGSADVFYIKNADKQILCSHKEGLIESLDTDDKIIFNDKVFKEVSIYED